MKEMYLHFNPSNGNDYQITKQAYRDYYKYGTIYFENSFDNFEFICRCYLEIGLNEVLLHYGETKLDYTDRNKYNKKVGRTLAKSRVSLQYVEIKSMDIKKGLSTIYIKTKIGFIVKVEYNHITKKYFIQTPSSY